MLLYQTMSRLPTGLAIQILSELHEFVNEPGNHITDVSGELLRTLSAIQERDYGQYIQELIETGKEVLPKNYLQLVKSELEKKQIYYSEKMIGSVLAKGSKRWNVDIFEAFVQVVKNYNDRQNDSFHTLINIVK